MFKLQGERDWEQKQVEKGGVHNSAEQEKLCPGAFRKDPIKGHEPSRKALNLETQGTKVSGSDMQSWGMGRRFVYRAVQPRWEYQTTWPASWKICIQVRKQQLELDMEQ